MDGDTAKIDIDEAQRLARALPESKRIIRPHHEWSTWVGAVVIGIPLGVALLVLAELALAPAFVSSFFGPPYKSERLLTPWWLVSVGGVAAVRLAWAWFRQKPVTIRVDGEGITEMEGDGARLHVRWRDARAFTQERHYRNRYGQRFVGQDVRIAAPSGAMIVLTTADNSFFWPDHRMRTVSRQRLDSLLEIARLLPPLDPKARDPRLVEERGTRGVRIASAIGTAIVVLTLYATVDHFTTRVGQRPDFPRLDAIVMTCILLVGSALRAILPVQRLLRHRRGEGDAATKHERLRAQAALAPRLVAVVVLVAFPWLTRASINQQCRGAVTSKSDYCTH